MSDSLTSVRQFCSHYGLKLNTNLGQHFLIDDDVLQTIVATADIKSSDHVVEIGPGIGVLTKELVAKAKHVTAIELDTKLIPLLEVYTGEPKNLTIEIGNALKAHFPKEPYKIVANIPYHITSPLLRKAFLESETNPTSLTLLIQREVAEKICDEENSSLLSIIVRLFGTPHLIITVPPKSFLPPPKVDSAVIHIESFKKPVASPEVIEQVFVLTKMAFSQKRKMLRRSFASFPGGAELLEAASIDGSKRPQELSLTEWISLAKIRLDNRRDATS